MWIRQALNLLRLILKSPILRGLAGVAQMFDLALSSAAAEVRFAWIGVEVARDGTQLIGGLEQRPAA
ncbi:MAG: hypothetical protein WCD20_02590 [Rhodomicrobium sp.]